MSTLQGKLILLTRAAGQNQELAQKLEAKGARVILYPCLEIIFHPVSLSEKTYDWVVYTSRNAFEALKSQSVQAKHIATVGPNTLPLSVETISPEKIFTAHELSKLFEGQSPQQILLPQGNLADNSLARSLERQGHEVTALTVYSTLKPAYPSPCPLVLDAITFLSPSAATNFLELTQSTPIDWNSTVIACIGSTTYAAVRKLGFDRAICAPVHTLDGLVECLENYF